MKRLLTLTFLTLSSSVFAKDFIVALGGGVVSKSRSKETATGSSTSALRSYGGGFANLQGQYNGLPIFDWVLQAQYTFSEGLAFYDYLNGNNRAQNPRQKVSIGELILTAGPRLNLLSLGRMKFFAGAGGALGSKVLIYDKADFLQANSGSETGFEQSDVASEVGQYYEGGFEYRGGELGFRLMAQHQEFKTGAFKTLGNHRLSIKQQLYSFNLIQEL